jgi:serine/threonine protein kinase
VRDASDSADREPEAHFLSTGSLVSERYEVVRRLKSGGMGAVYEVIDRQTSRRRALKTLLPDLHADPDLVARFEQEARVAAGVESEHVVEVLDAGVDATTGLPFLVMELLRGETLAAMLERRGTLRPSEVVLLLRQVSLALERTHDAGIVHRDLKPENLFVTKRDDGAPRLKILDFGIAKLTSRTTVPGTTRNFGTPVYMSPEQLRGDGDIDARADLYSLGHMAYALLVGKPYWASEALGPGGVYTLLLKIMAGAPEAASARAARVQIELPRAFDAWFAQAVAVAPSDRFESATELTDELARVLGVSVSAPQSDVLQERRTPFRARTRVWLVAGVLVGLSAIVFVALVWPLHPRSADDPSTRLRSPSAHPAAASPPPVSTSLPLREPGAAISSEPAPSHPSAPGSQPSTVLRRRRRAPPGPEPRSRPRSAGEGYDPTDLR